MNEQEKRAKVIAELERVADEANPWKESPPLRCDISYPLLIDALTLLKAQEPVEPTIGRAVEHDGHDSWWYQCGKCEKPIDWQDNYCRHCGKPVKWE